jgi:hypothetical protein
VTNGLKPGERVVVDGILKVQPGALVKATPVSIDGAMPTTTQPPAPSREAAATDSKKAPS